MHASVAIPAFRNETAKLPIEYKSLAIIGGIIFLQLVAYFDLFMR